MAEGRHPAILLPGGVLPADPAYGALVDALDPEVDAVAKDLEVYRADRPPAAYSLDLEVEGVLRAAADAGFDRFHLVGYSAGGAASVVFAAEHGDRLLSLALLEPAWSGDDGLDSAERAVWEEIGRVMALPAEEMMPAFVRTQLAPDVEPPPPPPGPTPPWMARRPAGLRAIAGAFDRCRLDSGALEAFRPPVYFALGGLSNPDYYARAADRLSRVFGDFTLEVFEDRHHFDPPHRAEPDRLAASLRALWARAEAP
jgi:pimeloyl-ACP methyl ester carboxylesterase